MPRKATKPSAQHHPPLVPSGRSWWPPTWHLPTHRPAPRKAQARLNPAEVPPFNVQTLFGVTYAPAVHATQRPCCSAAPLRQAPARPGLPVEHLARDAVWSHAGRLPPLRRCGACGRAGRATVNAPGPLPLLLWPGGSSSARWSASSGRSSTGCRCSSSAQTPCRHALRWWAWCRNFRGRWTRGNWPCGLCGPTPGCMAARL